MIKMNCGKGKSKEIKNREKTISISTIKGRGGLGALSFVIGSYWAERANLKAGDYVSVYWDRNDLCGMILKSKLGDGLKIMKRSNKGTLSFCFCRKEDHPKPKEITALQSVTVNADGEIYFDFPKSCFPEMIVVIPEGSKLERELFPESCHNIMP